MLVTKTSYSKRILFTYWLLAVSVLLSAGFIYRNQSSTLNNITQTPVALAVPLKSFPYAIKHWSATDVPIPQNIQRIIQNDDFVNRLYINSLTEQWANIYLAYSARPRTMLGHRPQVCYVSAGWVLDSTEKSQFITSSGKTVTSLIHYFHKPAPYDEQIVVLNFYILNGQLTCYEEGFSGIGWRTPNINGNPARYVAQIQISSVFENSVRAAAKDLTDEILKFLPAEKRLVKDSNLKNPTRVR